jgi:hypothetical protein
MYRIGKKKRFPPGVAFVISSLHRIFAFIA